jgi:hypothetical protein
VTRRLGERDAYERSPIALARCVHHDYHEWRNILWAQVALAETEERTTDRGDILPAGPETASVVSPGKRRWGPEDFPRPHQVREMDRDLGWRAVAVARVEAVVGKLAEYESHGETLRTLVQWVCVEGDVRLVRRRGWRHSGPHYQAALEMFGGDNQMWQALTDAWSLIAVMAVEGDVLRAAQEAGAVDEKALAWVTERGLVVEKKDA